MTAGRSADDAFDEEREAEGDGVEDCEEKSGGVCDVRSVRDRVCL